MATRWAVILLTPVLTTALDVLGFQWSAGLHQWWSRAAAAEGAGRGLLAMHSSVEPLTAFGSKAPRSGSAGHRNSSTELTAMVTATTDNSPSGGTRRQPSTLR